MFSLYRLEISQMRFKAWLATFQLKNEELICLTFVVWDVTLRLRSVLSKIQCLVQYDWFEICRRKYFPRSMRRKSEDYEWCCGCERLKIKGSPQTAGWHHLSRKSLRSSRQSFSLHSRTCAITQYTAQIWRDFLFQKHEESLIGLHRTILCWKRNVTR